MRIGTLAAKRWIWFPTHPDKAASLFGRLKGLQAKYQEDSLLAGQRAAMPL